MKYLIDEMNKYLIKNISIPVDTLDLHINIIS